MQIDLDLGLDLKNSTYNIKVAVPAPFEEGLDYLLPIILIEQVFFAEFSKIKLSDLIAGCFLYVQCTVTGKLLLET